jgi:predicted nucleotidyltransferase
VAIIANKEMSMTKNDILKALKEKKTYMQQTYEVEKIGLFGSYAKDKQNDSSDIDIYVEFKNKKFRNISGLWVYLEELYNKKVDLLHKHKNSKGAIFEAIQKEVIYG